MNPVERYRFFDNASTTKCSDRVLETLQECGEQVYGNPSSSHAAGEAASRRVRDARRAFAQAFGVEPNQVVFTGSGSESDNLAIQGVALQAYIESLKSKAPERLRVLSTCIEHAAVRKSCEALAEFGILPEFLEVNRQGELETETLKKALLQDGPTLRTVLVSVHAVNNILGTRQPIEKLAQLTKELAPGAVFHSDCVQALGKAPIPRAGSAVDLISISAHKIGGPKGIGALIILNKQLLTKNRIRPLIFGGGQEGGLRSGTVPAPLIAGFGAALEETLKNWEVEQRHYESLRNAFHTTLESTGLLSSGDVLWNTPDLSKAVPSIVSLALPKYPSSAFARMLEEEGFLVSTGSACSSRKPEADVVLESIGLSEQAASSGLRISFGLCNTVEDTCALAQAMSSASQRIKKLLGLSK